MLKKAIAIVFSILLANSDTKDKKAKIIVLVVIEIGWQNMSYFVCIKSDKMQKHHDFD